MGREFRRISLEHINIVDHHSVWVGSQYILIHIILDSHDSVTGIMSSTRCFHAYPVTLSQESCHPQGTFMHNLWLCHRNHIICRAFSCISSDCVTGIVSSIGRFHMYPVTHSIIYWKYENTRHRPKFFVLFELAVRIETIEFVLNQSEHRSYLSSTGRRPNRRTKYLWSQKSWDETRRGRKFRLSVRLSVELQTDDCQPC